MGELEFLLLLLVGAAALVRVADLIAVPYPIVLVLGGLAAGLIPGAPNLELEPDVIFLVFLPPLLHAVGWTASPQELRADWRPVSLMVVGLTVVTLVAVAVVAHAVVDGMPWAVAFLMGAILAPTDPVAALTTYARIGVPERVRSLVEGEAMLNDAVPLVAFGVAVTAATTGEFSFGETAFDVVVKAVGGTAVGLGIGWVSRHTIRKLPDQSLSIFVTLLTAYAGYVVAEELHVSGVLGAVVSGIYGGWYSSSTFDADTRLSALAFWDTIIFMLNVVLFVLLGVQFPNVIDELEGGMSAGELILPGLALSAVVIAVRVLWLAIPEPGLGDSRAERFVVGWSGMRGAISLAAALSVGPEIAQRPQLLFLTVVVIIVTLVGQGLTLPLIVRALGVKGEREWSPDEAIARLEAAQSALDRLDELEDEGATEEQLRRLRELYRARFRQCQLVIGGDPDARRSAHEPRLRFSALRKELIGVERVTVVGLRDEGRLRSADLRSIERDLDLEESRLRST